MFVYVCEKRSEHRYFIGWAHSKTSSATAGIDAILTQKHKNRIRNKKKTFLDNCPITSNEDDW